MTEKQKELDPYRVLFPFGIIWALWGAFLWPANYAHLIRNYPGFTGHPDAMIAGFLGAFISGFLMTAIPRFTGSKHASRKEILFIAILTGFQLISAMMWRFDYFHIIQLLQVLFLFHFARIRFFFEKF